MKLYGTFGWFLVCLLYRLPVDGIVNITCVHVFNRPSGFAIELHQHIIKGVL